MSCSVLLDMFFSNVEDLSCKHEPFLIGIIQILLRWFSKLLKFFMVWLYYCSQLTILLFDRLKLHRMIAILLKLLSRSRNTAVITQIWVKYLLKTWQLTSTTVLTHRWRSQMRSKELTYSTSSFSYKIFSEKMRIRRIVLRLRHVRHSKKR